jgi:uncharacterized membrane protein
MIRFFTHLFAGIVLGGIIHITVILIMPIMSTQSAWAVISRLVPENQMRVLDSKYQDLRATLGLDPAFVYAICAVDLNNGPIRISGDLPTTFWTAALIGSDGSVPYSTNSRTNNNRDINIGIFNADQARLLKSEDLDIDLALQIVRVPYDQMTAIVRILPSHSTVAKAIEDRLASLECSSI